MNVLTKCPSILNTTATNALSFGSVNAQHVYLIRGRILKQSVIPVLLKTRHAATKTSGKIQEKLRIKDVVPPEFELVYRVPVSAYIIAAQNISSVCTVLAITFGAYKYITGNATMESSVFQGLENVELSKEQLLICVILFAIANIMLLIFTSKLPLRIYRSAESYRAVYRRPLSMKIKYVEFKPGSVVQAPVSSSKFLPWSTSLFKIGSKNNIILEHCFRKPADFHSMLQNK